MSLQAMSCVSRKGGTEKVDDCAGSVIKTWLCLGSAMTGTEKATSNLETSHPLCRVSISRAQGPFFSYTRLAKRMLVNWQAQHGIAKLIGPLPFTIHTSSGGHS